MFIQALVTLSVHPHKHTYIHTYFQMTKYKRIPVKVSIYLRYLHQGLGGGRDLITQFPEYPRRSVYWHANLPIEKLTNKGKPRIISECSVRHIKNTLKQWRRNRGVFCSHDKQQLAGVSKTDVSNRTVRSCLNEKKLSVLAVQKEDMKSR